MGAGELGAHWLLVALRVAPLTLWAPALGGLGWGWSARLAATLLFTAWLAPLAPAVGPWWRELGVGGLLALASATPFWALRIAGAATDDRQARGRIGDALMLAALCLYGALGGARLTCAALVDSYAAAAPDAPTMAAFAAAGARLVALGVTLALPVLVLVLAVEVVYALAARFAPAVAATSERAVLRVGVVLFGWAALAWLTLKTVAHAWGH